MKQVDFTISSYPCDAAICRIKTIYGKISAEKILLLDDNQFSYYFPEEFTNVDSIEFNFYDEYGRYIVKKNFNIEYISDIKEYRVLERLPY